MPNQVQLAIEDGLFELAGPESIWIWAHTCPVADCSCHSVLILATTDGREALLQRGIAVRAAWNAGSGYKQAAAQLTDLDAFRIDLNTADALPLAGDELLSLDAHPRVRAVVERLDGEVLDAMGRLWYRGKGKPDPETQRRAAKQIIVRDWSPGDLIGYDELCGVRDDLYRQGERVFEALELYCPKSSCTCGEVVIDFTQGAPGDRTHVGHITMERSGEARLEPDRNRADALKWLWAAFQKRHPRYRQRFTQREAACKAVGNRLMAEPEKPQPAQLAAVGGPVGKPVGKPVGRNDKCPCGSGRKYKKCCAEAPSQETGLGIRGL